MQNINNNRFILVVCLFLKLGLLLGYGQTTIQITPDKDNSLMNTFFEASSGLGPLFSGNTCSDTQRRAMLHFDIDGVVPSGNTITNVTLTLNVDRVSLSATGNQDYTLHVLETDWGEGTSNTEFGYGINAVSPDATWNYAVYPTVNWTNPGGDFNVLASATTSLASSTGTYIWSSAQMSIDVQSWKDNPATNFGWILIGDESSICNSRRFGSKDFGVAPVLSITYEPTLSNPTFDLAESIRIYPNPANSVVTISTEVKSVRVYDVMGKQVMSATQNSFNIVALNNGVYFVKVEDLNGNTAIKRLIKK